MTDKCKVFVRKPSGNDELTGTNERNHTDPASVENGLMVESKTEVKQNCDHPKDEGYAWFILLGGVLEMFLVIGVQKASGLLFVAFQEKFKSNSTMTSLPSTVLSICYSIMSILVMNVGMKVTTSRTLVMIGSVLMCTSFVVTSQAQDIRVLLFSLGVLNGFASAFMMPPTVATICQYFERRSGFANSLAVSGSCVGGLVFAPLITKLLPLYGYDGCFLIVAGLFLNGCVCGALFRPTAFYTKRGSEKFAVNHKTRSETERLLSESSDNRLRDTTRMQRRNDEKQYFQLGSYAINDTNCTNNGLKKNMNDNDDLRGQSALMSSFEDKHTSTYGKKDLAPSLCINYNDKGKKNDNNKHWMRTFINLFDFQNLKEPVFIAFLISVACIGAPSLMIVSYIAPHAKDLGFDAEEIEKIVMVFSFVDLVARLILGYVSDQGWMPRSTLVGLSTMLVAVIAQLLRFCTSYALMIVFAVVLGLAYGLYFNIMQVVLTDYMTLKKLDSCLGFTAVVDGFSNAGLYYLVGFLRDYSGSYVVSYHVVGCLAFIGAASMLSLPFIEKYQNAKKMREITLHPQ
ncbi:hypothetical protein ACF0H5_000841 [Mactra antiquata]